MLQHTLEDKVIKSSIDPIAGKNIFFRATQNLLNKKPQPTIQGAIGSRKLCYHDQTSLGDGAGVLTTVTHCAKAKKFKFGFISPDHIFYLFAKPPEYLFINRWLTTLS